MIKLLAPALLGAASTLALVSGAAAAEVDLSPLVNEAIADILVPVALAVVPTIGALLVMPLRRFLDQRAGDLLAQRVDEVLDKAIAYAAQQGSAWVTHEHLNTEVDGWLINVAADYAVQHAPTLMAKAGTLAAARASDAARQAADTLLKQKVVARLAGHPDVQALKANAPAPVAAAA